MVYDYAAFDRHTYNFIICVSKFYMCNLYCSKYRDVNVVKYICCYGVQLAFSFCVLKSSFVCMSNKIRNISVEITIGQSGFDFWFGQEVLHSMKTCPGPIYSLLHEHLDTIFLGLNGKSVNMNTHTYQIQSLRMLIGYFHYSIALHVAVLNFAETTLHVH
jgi:hypothetical protein